MVSKGNTIEPQSKRIMNLLNDVFAQATPEKPKKTLKAAKSKKGLDKFLSSQSLTQSPPLSQTKTAATLEETPVESKGPELPYYKYAIMELLSGPSKAAETFARSEEKRRPNNFAFSSSITFPNRSVNLSRISDLQNKPKINPISEKLAQLKKRDEMNKKGVWDHLHGLDKKLRERRDRSYIDYKFEQESKALQACTFRPDISRSSSYNETFRKYTDQGVYERNVAWKNAVLDRIKAKQDQQEREMESICVFMPRIKGLRERRAITPVRGMENFVERYRIANKYREEKFTFLNQRDLSTFGERKRSAGRSTFKTKRKSVTERESVWLQTENNDGEDYYKAKTQLHRCLHGLDL